MKKVAYLFALSILLINCTPKKWVLTDSSSIAIPIDSSLDAIADKEMQNFIAPIKETIDKDMNQVIGYATEDMERGKPEGLLSNWSADVYLQAANDFSDEPVDMAVVNLGGLRTPILKGDIRIGDIFRLMPFENELVILWLKGSDIKELLNIFASEGGQAVAGIQMDIKNKEAVNCTIQGKEIDDNKLYTVATNDYLAGGNDRMLPLLKAEKRLNTDLKLRNILLESVIRSTKEGKNIESKLDGRIRDIE